MVWNRAHVEALSPQTGPSVPLAWPQLPPGVTFRLLSIDENDGAATLELRLPVDWVFDAYWSVSSDVDVYVIAGALRVGDTELVSNDFSFRPAGYINGAVRVREPATLLVFVQGGPQVVLHARESAGRVDRAHRAIVERLPAMSVPAKPPLTDREVKPNIFSRTLRMNPMTGERIFITGARSESSAEQRGDGRIEWHECVEEIYSLASWVSMDHPDGRLRLDPGWYCFRPPGIPHGPFQSGPAAELATLFRVSSTLTNNYVSMREAKKLWRNYPADHLFDRVRDRIDRPDGPSDALCGT